jgi:hypothetical protein
VLVNLLGNAVKFTDESGVALRARWEERDGGVASFEVEDTGHGIGEDELGKLFESFAQTESARASKEGTGLGLAISQNFVSLMGGRIRVRSEHGKGSAFSFAVTLPEGIDAAEDNDDVRVVGLESGQPAWRILCVDDTAENRALIGSLLEGVGFDVRLASCGARGGLLIGDVSASNTAVDGIDAQDPELAAELRRAVREYRFDDFLGLLGRLT